MVKNERKRRKEMIKYRMKQCRDNIKAYRSMIQGYKRELDLLKYRESIE